MLVEAPILDQLDAGAQQRRHVRGREHQPVLAVDRKHAADHGGVEPEHRQLRAVARLQPRDGIRIRAYRHQLRVAQFIDEAYAARVQIEAVSASPVHTRTRLRIAHAVMQPVKFLLQVARRDRRAGVQFQRRGIHARRHRPVASLKFTRHHAVQMHHPDDGDGGRNQQTC